MMTQMLIFLCMPYFGNKHPCFEEEDSTDNDIECRLFGRPRMYVQKRKYIPRDDFTFEMITVYEDIMKTGEIDLPWEALAAHVAPWDPYEINIRRSFHEPYPYELEPRKELQIHPVDSSLLKRMFVTDYNWKSSLLDELMGHNNKDSQLQGNYSENYPKRCWPIIAAFIFKIFTYVFFDRFSTYINNQFKNYLDENLVGSRRMLKAKRRLIQR